MWINAVSCCEFHFYGFVIMNFSVCFLEKVKIDMLSSFLYFHYVKKIFYRARSFFVESCGPSTEILEPTLAFVHDGRGTSINVLLHPYLRDTRSSNFTASKHNLFYFTGEFLDHFSDRFRPLLRTCSHSPRDYAQVPNN
jgi:hypothetical protein